MSTRFRRNNRRIPTGWAGAAVIPGIACLPICLLIMGGSSCRNSALPSIEITVVPPASEGGPDIAGSIEGRVTGARPGQKIVLFARSGVWWVQPLWERPFTAIQPDSKWKNSTHLGTVYAALLVDPGYNPPLTADALPQTGGAIRAVATVEGRKPAPQPRKTLRFSGYQWEVRPIMGTPGGSRNMYDPSNAWVDASGFLHLRIAKSATGWTSAETDLSRSLGYGTYRFIVHEVNHLEPAVVLALSTFDDSGPDREMDIETSRWGESEGKNAQFVVQPYFVPANVVRFTAPAGPLVYSFAWEPRRVSFQIIRGSAPGGKSDVVAAHVFTSGVPSPGHESVRMNLYVFDNKQNPMQHEVEVIIEKFEYLP